MAKKMLVRKDVIAFLLGEGSLDGVGFGDTPPMQPRYWWRKYLRRQPRAAIRAGRKEK